MPTQTANNTEEAEEAFRFRLCPSSIVHFNEEIMVVNLHRRDANLKFQMLLRLCCLQKIPTQTQSRPLAKPPFYYIPSIIHPFTVENNNDTPWLTEQKWSNVRREDHHVFFSKARIAKWSSGFQCYIEKEEIRNARLATFPTRD
jgi:hypothetical protein